MKVRTSYIRKINGKNYRYLITVLCRDCKKELTKRIDTIISWKGRCRSCAQKLKVTIPEYREKLIATGKKVTKRQGGVPNAVKFKNGSTPWNKGISGFQVGEKHYNWKGGVSREPYSVDWTNTLKRSIRERDCYTCQICSQYGIDVHHIDYDKKNCNPDNLVTLCRKCHTKTNHNREDWTKFFSTPRRIT